MYLFSIFCICLFSQLNTATWFQCCDLWAPSWGKRFLIPLDFYSYFSCVKCRDNGSYHVSHLIFFSSSLTQIKYKEKNAAKWSNNDKTALVWCDSCARSFLPQVSTGISMERLFRVSVINAQTYRWFESQTGKLRASWIDWQGNDHPNLLIIVSTRIVYSCPKVTFYCR